MEDETLWQRLDDVFKTAHEDAWLSSRYAAEADRRKLTALYCFDHELARISRVAKEPLAGQMRFAWWRSRLEPLAGQVADVGEAGIAGEKPKGKAGQGKRLDGEAALLDLLAEIPASDLEAYIDAHEAVYLGADDAKMDSIHALAWCRIGIACDLLGEACPEIFKPIIQEFETMRFGRPQSTGWLKDTPRLPVAVRPILAYLSLRHLYEAGTRGTALGGVRARMAVFWAILTGRL